MQLLPPRSTEYQPITAHAEIQRVVRTTSWRMRMHISCLPITNALIKMLTLSAWQKQQRPSQKKKKQQKHIKSAQANKPLWQPRRYIPYVTHCHLSVIECHDIDIDRQTGKQQAAGQRHAGGLKASNRKSKCGSCHGSNAAKGRQAHAQTHKSRLCIYAKIACCKQKQQQTVWETNATTCTFVCMYVW